MLLRRVSSLKTMRVQVRENVATALSPLTPAEQEILKRIADIMAPVQNVTWRSGRPENN